jgi:hypothetical protein
MRGLSKIGRQRIAQPLILLMQMATLVCFSERGILFAHPGT